MTWFSDVIGRQTKKYTTVFLPKERVDIDYDDKPVRAGTAYCRLWLVEMHLAKDIEWGTKRYPAVYASTSYYYGKDQITLPCLADTNIVNTLKSVASQGNIHNVIACNYELTPLFPFNRGLVTIRAGLFSLIDTTLVQTFVGVMSQLSGTLPLLAEYSKALKVIEPLGKGIEQLLNIEDHRLELGYMQTLVEVGGGGNNLLRPGYFAVIRAEEKTIHSQDLCVIRDSLHTGDSGRNKEFMKQHTSFTSYSYMLFRIEVRPEQEWKDLTEISDLVQHAREKLVNGKQQDQDEVHCYLLPAIKIAIIRSPDIAEADRDPMIAKIQHTLEVSGLHGHGREAPLRSLHAIMQQPLPLPDPQLIEEIAKLQEIFNRG